MPFFVCYHSVMKLRKSCAAILIASAIIWAIVCVLGVAFGLGMRSSLKSGEGIGFIFAAIFLVLFESIGWGVSVLSAVFLLADILALCLLPKAKRGGIAALGVMTLLLGSPIAGITLFVLHGAERRG